MPRGHGAHTFKPASRRWPALQTRAEVVVVVVEVVVVVVADTVVVVDTVEAVVVVVLTVTVVVGLAVVWPVAVGAGFVLPPSGGTFWRTSRSFPWQRMVMSETYP